MKILNVSLSGFDRLFEGYRIAANENRKAYGDNLFDFLNHCMISFELSELTTIEMFYLKKFASSIHIIDTAYHNFTNAEKEFDLNQKISGLLSLHDEILHDDDIDKSESFIDNILPIGCKSYHIFVIFKGPSILSISGGFPDKMFMTNNQLDEVYIGDKLMENRIIEFFYESFYSFMAKKVTNIDLVTEFMVNKKLYQYSEDMCDLAYVHTPYGEINFFGNSEDNFSRQLSIIKEKEKHSPYVLKDQMFLTFVMNTTISTFMYLHLYTNFIVDNQDLKIIFSSNEVDASASIVEKYNARISNFMDYLISHRKGLSEKNELDLNKLNFIFNGDKICYSIQLSLSQIICFTSTFSSLEKVLSVDEFNAIRNKMSSSADIINNLIG